MLLESILLYLEGKVFIKQSGVIYDGQNRGPPYGSHCSKNAPLTSLVYEGKLEEIWSNLVPGIENAVGVWRRGGGAAGTEGQ